jgi:hypothetical protein
MLALGMCVALASPVVTFDHPVTGTPPMSRGVSPGYALKTTGRVASPDCSEVRVVGLRMK